MGVDTVLVEVEVDMSLGMPFFNLVGLADGAGRESKVRVTSALKNAGFELPQKRITVNLAPADVRKEGTGLELPIALGVLAAAELLPSDSLSPYLFAGELSLDGALKPMKGALSLALAARDFGFRGVLLPAASAPEAARVEGIEIIAVPDLRSAVAHLIGESPLPSLDGGARSASAATPLPDMRDVRGQPDVKNALEVAAAGGHHLLLCGPPGSGKSMLARRLPSILPSLTLDEALETTKVHSAVGLVPPGQSLVSARPFRAPHHTLSDAGLVGGGPSLRPGELSLAHHGVLFLDELPEFRPYVLDMLRQPLEEGQVLLARAGKQVLFPCQVMLVAAMNPCPCGWFNVPDRRCTCGERKVLEYHGRVSGPLLDRIDITLQTRALSYAQLAARGAPEAPSEHHRARVEAARARQRHRFSEMRGVACNAQMSAALTRRLCRLDAKGERLLEEAFRILGLSARAFDRVLRLARTHADLADRAEIAEEDLHLAVDCRMLDRKSWLHGAPAKPSYLGTLATGVASGGDAPMAPSPPTALRPGTGSPEE